MTWTTRAIAALLCLCCVSAPARGQARAPAIAVDPPPPGPVLVTAPLPRPSPRVALETSHGRIVLELYPQQAPATVANFLAYARAGHYNGTIFHRAIAGVLLQGGAFTPDLQPKPERAPVANEAGNGLANTRGTLAAARRPSVGDSAGAQFFINLADNRGFDRKATAPPEAAGFAVFGRVIDGLEVADRIAALPTGARGPFAADVPVPPVVIERAELLPPAPVAPAPPAGPPTRP